MELEEAAFIDGANHFTIFYKIFLPLSKPALATVAMFYGVNRWNSYFWAMQLLQDDKKAPLQVMLKKMLVDRVANAADAALVTAESMSSPTTIIYACLLYTSQPGGQRQTDPPDPLTGLRAGSVTVWPPQWNPCG